MPRSQVVSRSSFRFSFSRPWFPHGHTVFAGFLDGPAPIPMVRRPWWTSGTLTSRIPPCLAWEGQGNAPQRDNSAELHSITRQVPSPGTVSGMAWHGEAGRRKRGGSRSTLACNVRLQRSQPGNVGSPLPCRLPLAGTGKPQANDTSFMRYKVQPVSRKTTACPLFNE